MVARVAKTTSHFIFDLLQIVKKPFHRGKKHAPAPHTTYGFTDFTEWNVNQWVLRNGSVFLPSWSWVGHSTHCGVSWAGPGLGPRPSTHSTTGWWN